MLNCLRPHARTILLLVAGAVILAACGAPAGNPEDGKRWYAMHNCSACHGPNGNDGKALPVAGLGMSFSKFEGILRKPYSPSMRAYPEAKLSKQDAADIYAWLKSLK
jgi:mono/diheme cytochrome c family protein